MMIVGFLLVLGPLVTLHELGHYLVGRWFGVKADVFSIGFGKELTGWTDRRGTRWRISALPLGGYVQFAGDMSPASQPSEEYLALPEEERAKYFQAKPLWQKALIVAAGPVTNLLIAVAIFAGFAMAFGMPTTPPVIDGFSEDSPALAAGLEEGDRIVAIDGDPIDDFQQVREHVIAFPGHTISLTYERDGQTATVPITIAAVDMVDRFGNKSQLGRVGISSGAGELVPVGPVASIGFGFQECWTATKMMVTGIWQIITGERSVEELGGPIKIAKFSGEQLSLGWLAFINFVAFISLNLAFINLLPIPVLDGGHLAFYAAEAIRRKPASPRSQELAFRTGMAFVLALMLFVTIIDIASLPIFGS
ncbi:RIP metalloprotease RseP [Alteraurantiacibacter aquimixticola]|uniref:Zinc metalloprotease n=2 Tax=Alteraurantiacibacter aquimixticola TaxID=2489173 RepID=A0A4T3F6K8_9SPHN|nr:RIP metalloprotease RseP [Alteraurantiacibacter aquimixticola]